MTKNKKNKITGKSPPKPVNTRHRYNIRELFSKIWNNLILLRTISILTGSVTLLTGAYFVGGLIQQWQSEDALEYLQSHGYAGNMPQTQIDEWDAKLEQVDSVSNSDAFNYYKGIALYHTNTEFSGGYSVANRYLASINYSSVFYPRAVILRGSNYVKYLEPEDAANKIKQLTQSVELNDIIFPGYYWLRMSPILLEQNYEALDSLYYEFVKNYPKHSVYNNTLEVIRGQLYMFDAEQFFAVPSIDYTLKLAIYMYNRKSPLIPEFTQYFKRIIKDKKEIQNIKLGYDMLGVVPPNLITPETISVTKSSLEQWVNYQISFIEIMLKNEIVKADSSGKLYYNISITSEPANKNY